MDAFWVSLGVVALYSIGTLCLVLSALAVFFAYRISRIAGFFGAWSLLIGALALTSLEEFLSFGITLLSGYSKVQSTAESITFGLLVFDAVVLVAIPASFFGAMYKLHGLFKVQTSKSIEATAPDDSLG
jgi:hypothetical protein